MGDRLLDHPKRRFRSAGEEVGLGSHRGPEDAGVGVQRGRIEPGEGGPRVVVLAAPGQEPGPDDRQVRRPAAAPVEREPGRDLRRRLVPAPAPDQDVRDERREVAPEPPLHAAGPRRLPSGPRRLERLLLAVRDEQVQPEVVGGDDEQLRGLVAGEAMSLRQLAQAGVDLAEADEVGAEHAPGAALVAGRADLDGTGDRGLADRDRLRPAAEAHERPAERPEDERPLPRGRALRHEPDRLAMVGEGRVGFAPSPRHVPETGVDRAGQAGLGGRVDQAERVLEELDRPLLAAVQVGRVGGPATVVDPVGEGGQVVGRELRLEADRPLEQSLDVAERLDRVGRRRRCDRRPVGLDRPARRGPVPGELGRRTGRAGIPELGLGRELAGEPLVELASLGLRRLALDDLAEELVAEGVPAVVEHDEDPRPVAWRSADPISPAGRSRSGPRTRSSTGRPITARARTIAVVSSSRPATRAIRTSTRDGSRPSAAVAAAASSSANSGWPSDRRQTVSMTASGTGPPSIASSWRTRSCRQRQRIALARAFLKDAPILLLDEATSALDHETEEMIKEASSRLMRGRTVIAIAHRLSTLRSFDRLIVLKAGKIIRDGSPAELMEVDDQFMELMRRDTNRIRRAA